MKSDKLTSFKDGWVVGNFEPSLFRSRNFEFGVKKFPQGHVEPCHFQISATEITVILKGEVRLGGLRFHVGDVVLLEPLEHADFEALSDCELAVVKAPSEPNDKVICSGECR